MRQFSRVFAGTTGLASEVVAREGSDSRGLSSQNWVQLKNRIRLTYIITACQCTKSKTIVGTVLMQRERHMRRYYLSSHLWENFITDLVHFTIKVTNNSNEVVLAAGINEHFINRKLLKELKKIRMIDSFIKKFHVPGSVSCTTGSVLIDRVQVSSNLVLRKMSIFS